MCSSEKYDTLAGMKRWLPVTLVCILLLVIVMFAWVGHAQRLSVGEGLSFRFQPTSTTVVIEDQTPRRSLVFVDFFAGY